MYTTYSYDGYFVQTSQLGSSRNLQDDPIYSDDNPPYYDWGRGGFVYINPYKNETIIPLLAEYNNDGFMSNLSYNVVRNKDRTAADIVLANTDTLIKVLHVYTGSGQHLFMIPTGCVGVDVKLWGAGGSCPTDSLDNGWTAYGGGGGFAMSRLNYPVNTIFAVSVGEAGKGGDSSLTGTLQYSGGSGGGSSECWVYSNGLWSIVAVAGGGGGAGAGATGPSSQTGSYGGPAASPGFRGISNVSSSTRPGMNGFYGVGGAGGYAAGTDDDQDGSNFVISQPSPFSPFMATGGTSSFSGTGSMYTFIYAGGAGGAGYGGGGAGDPGIDPLVGDLIQSCGGGGGENFSPLQVWFSTGSETWFPLNSADSDFQSLNPDAGVGVYAYGQGGSPFIDGVGDYNPTGTDGLVIFTCYYLPTGGSANNYAVFNGNSFTYKTNFIVTGQTLKSSSELTVYRGSPSTSLTDGTMFIPYSTGVEQSFQGYSLYVLSSGSYSSVVNKSYLIKSNYYETGTNEYKVILDQFIDTNAIVDGYFHQINDDFVSLYFFSSNISKTPISNIISYTGTNNKITILTNSNPIDITTSKYVLAQTSTGSIDVCLITKMYQDQDSSAYIIELTGCNIESDIGPYAYLVDYNYSALYTLQFVPQSVYKSVFYNVTLLNLTIPNRSILTSFIKGIRYLGDFPYIYLQIWNAGDDGLPDPQVINNIYTNNINGPPNGVLPPVFPNESVFQIFVTSGGSSEENFINYSCPVVARIKFIPGYNNIRLRLLDPRGNVIRFDNTPVKASDAIFGTGVIPDDLLRMVASFSFSRI